MASQVNEQRHTFSTSFEEDGEQFTMKVFLWYGRCNPKQKMYFSITGEIENAKTGDDEAGGCLHDQIENHFPELAHLIKWHLCSDEGPMHYIANTLFNASDRDCWGTRKGEHRKNPKGLPMWSRKSQRMQAIVCQHEQPEPIVLQYEPVVGEGKERDFDAARKSAVWFDATDDELCSDNLKELLEARLPQLVKEFLLDMVEAGFDVEFAEV